MQYLELCLNFDMLDFECCWDDCFGMGGFGCHWVELALSDFVGFGKLVGIRVDSAGLRYSTQAYCWNLPQKYALD